MHTYLIIRIQRAWRRFMTTHTLVLRYKLVHTHENMHDMSYYQRKAILRTQTVIHCSKEILERIKAFVRRKNYPELEHILSEVTVSDEDVRLFLTVYLSVLNTDYTLPFAATNAIHSRLYDLATDILIRWNKILDTMSLSHEIIVPFFLNAHAYCRDFPLCVNETRRILSPIYQRVLYNLTQELLYNLRQEPNPNIHRMEALTVNFRACEGQAALDSIDEALRIAAGLPTVRDH